MARPRPRARAGQILAAPQPVASTERAQPDTETKADSPIARLFRAARKALLDDDEPQPPAAKKRSGETGKAVVIMATRKLAGPIRRAFRLAKAIISRSDELPAFEPPDPRDPFNPAPLTGEFPFIGHFEEAMPPPANCPSANL